MGSSSIVQYGSFDIDDLDEVDRQVDAIAGSVYVDVEVGDNVFRALPPLVGRKALRVTAKHFIDAVPGLEKMVVFACPRIELKEYCRACERVEELNRSKNPLDRDRAWKIKASLSISMNVINRANEDAGPRVYSFGKMVHNQLKAIRKSPRMGGDYTDPSENGFDLVIHRVGTGKNDTKYTVAADRNNSPLHVDPEIANEWIRNQHDLDSMIDTEFPEQLLLAWRDLATAGRSHAQVPADVGSRQQKQKKRSAVSDAQGDDIEDAEIVDEEVEYDDDFNPIKK